MEVDWGMRIQGRDLSPGDLDWLSGWIEAHPQWSRSRLRHELCLHWEWRNGMGQLKTYAARALLAKLEQQGLLRLPPLRLQMRRAQPWSRRERALEHSLEEAEAIEGTLGGLRPVELRLLVAGSGPSAARRPSWRAITTGVWIVRSGLIFTTWGWIGRAGNWRSCCWGRRPGGARRGTGGSGGPSPNDRFTWGRWPIRPAF